MDLHLVRPVPEHERLYGEMMDEWEAEGGKIFPGAIRRRDRTYEQWLAWLEEVGNEKTCPTDRMPQHVCLSFSDEGGLLGAVSIRPRLNEELMLFGGHIGYGIRPSERGRGCAKAQLAAALVKCREEYGIADVLVTCNKDNPASASVIRANGGVMENEVAEPDGQIVQRYWIRGEGK